MTNSFKDLVPDYYTRKQTLTNAERYITPELKELEDMILGAEDKLFALEYESVFRCQGKDGSRVVRIQKTAKAVAQLDVFASLHWLQNAITMYARRSMKRRDRYQKWPSSGC